MDSRRGFWLGGAFAAAFVAVGFTHWRIPYAEVSLPGTLMGVGVVVVALGALAARVFGRAPALWTVLVVGGAVPAAVLARVVRDVAADPTSHNLWPFEIVIAAFVGAFAASIGVVVGSLIRPPE